MFQPSSVHGLQPYVIERRKVSTTHQVSFGVLYFSLDIFHKQTMLRTKNALSKGYSQLKKITSKYKVAVVDIRYEKINEFEAYQNVLNRLKTKKYGDLSGVILITFETGTNQITAGLKLIFIPNPQAENPIYETFFFKKPKQVLSYSKHYLLEIPSLIRYRKPGLQDWLNIEPGYIITYKGEEYGTLFINK
ncbi:MAG: hypothetical protein HWN67_16705 [Candidatus Helarchaeota archaeon]|nr:hypothetical protein [Candidatus Helarchaeota archaeon]